MTQNGILELLCTYLNGLELDCTFVVGPLSEAAPEGEHCSLYFGDAEAVGLNPMYPGPVKVAGEKKIYYPWVGSIYLTEIEGTGETIRKVANKLRTREFLEYSKANAFTVMGVSPITSVNFSTSDFYVSQKRITLSVNWIDEENATALSFISVEGESTTLDDGKESIFEVSTN